MFFTSRIHWGLGAYERLIQLNKIIHCKHYIIDTGPRNLTSLRQLALDLQLINI